MNTSISARKLVVTNKIMAGFQRQLAIIILDYVDNFGFRGSS